jgi:hypothetical protein
MTGFTRDPDIGSKWLQLLKDVAPSPAHVTIMFNPRVAVQRGTDAGNQTVAPGSIICVASFCTKR